MWRHIVASKRFADTHPEGVAVRALGDVGSKIDVVLLTQLKSQSSPSSGQEVSVLYPLEQLTPARNDATEPAEYDQAKPLRQDQAILQLGCKRYAGEVLPSGVSSQFIAGAIDAIPIKRGAAAGPAEIGVIGEDLLFAYAPIFIELRSIRLEGVFAA